MLDSIEIQLYRIRRSKVFQGFKNFSKSIKRMRLVAEEKVFLIFFFLSGIEFFTVISFILSYYLATFYYRTILWRIKHFSLYFKCNSFFSFSSSSSSSFSLSPPLPHPPRPFLLFSNPSAKWFHLILLLSHRSSLLSTSTLVSRSLFSNACNLLRCYFSS